MTTVSSRVPAVDEALSGACRMQGLLIGPRLTTAIDPTPTFTTVLLPAFDWLTVGDRPQWIAQPRPKRQPAGRTCQGRLTTHVGSWEGPLAGEVKPINNAWMNRGVMTDIVLRRLTRLPDDFIRLEEESVVQGFSMMQRFRIEWHEGSNRFAQDGEVFVGAFDGQRLVGVGGLNIDPYAGDPDVGRLRHIHVLQSHRRSGAGAALVRHLLAGAVGRFKVVRLWTDRASDFYDKLGFDQVSEPKVTHQIAIQ